MTAADRHHRPVLLFDLGNIVNEFAGIREIQRLWQPERSLEEIRRDWLASEAVIASELGRVTPAAFARAFVEEWSVPVPPRDFEAVFLSWARPPFPGIRPLLDSLKRRYRTACLSNTSALHWQRLGFEYGWDGYFDRQYLSFQMGLMKPDAAIYRAVVADLGVAPGDILFFDDTPENVEGARAVGLQAHVVVGVEGLRRACEDLALF